VPSHNPLYSLLARMACPSFSSTWVGVAAMGTTIMTTKKQQTTKPETTEITAMGTTCPCVKRPTDIILAWAARMMAPSRFNTLMMRIVSNRLGQPTITCAS
jgi:hypothetical protein